MVKKYITFHSAVMGGRVASDSAGETLQLRVRRRTLTLEINLNAIRIECIVFRLAPMDPMSSRDRVTIIFGYGMLPRMQKSKSRFEVIRLNVPKSADGCHIISEDHNEDTIIYSRVNRAIARNSAHKHVFKEQRRESLCGDYNSHSWSNIFPVYTPEFYCKKPSALSSSEDNRGFA